MRNINKYICKKLKRYLKGAVNAISQYNAHCKWLLLFLHFLTHYRSELFFDNIYDFFCSVRQLLKKLVDVTENFSYKILKKELRNSFFWILYIDFFQWFKGYYLYNILKELWILSRNIAIFDLIIELFSNKKDTHSIHNTENPPIVWNLIVMSSK